MGWTKVTDAGLKERTGLTNLGFLRTRDAEVTKEGNEAIRKAIPRGQILGL